MQSVATSGYCAIRAGCPGNLRGSYPIGQSRKRRLSQDWSLDTSIPDCAAKSNRIWNSADTTRPGKGFHSQIQVKATSGELAHETYGVRDDVRLGAGLW